MYVYMYSTSIFNKYICVLCIYMYVYSNKEQKNKNQQSQKIWLSEDQETRSR